MDEASREGVPSWAVLQAVAEDLDLIQERLKEEVIRRSGKTYHYKMMVGLTAGENGEKIKLGIVVPTGARKLPLCVRNRGELRQRRYAGMLWRHQLVGVATAADGKEQNTEITVALWDGAAATWSHSHEWLGGAMGKLPAVGKDVGRAVTRCLTKDAIWHKPLCELAESLGIDTLNIAQKSEDLYERILEKSKVADRPAAVDAVVWALWGELMSTPWDVEDYLTGLWNPLADKAWDSL